MEDKTNSKPEEAATPQVEPTATPPTPAQQSVTPAGPVGTSNGFAIAALVVGIVAAVTGWAPFWGILVGATAIVLGLIGLKKASGKGMAIAGIVTGAVGALWGLIVTVFFIIALVIGTAATTGMQQAIDKENSETQSLVDAKKDFTQGETANFANKYEVKVNSVDTNFTGSQIFQPAEGNQYIMVNLTVKNISDESEYFTPFNFELVENGLAKTSAVVNAPDELEAGNLAAGASTTGNVVYEVSEGASDLKLQYDVTVFDQSYSSKKLTYTLAI